MEQMYASLKSFSLQLHNLDEKMMLQFIHSNLKEENHQSVYEIIEKYCLENQNDCNISELMEKHLEDLNYVYYTVKCNNIPIKLLKMIYKFISFNVESNKVDKERIVD
jgi:hypothetical protein